MDPLAHTLLGTALSRTRLTQRQALETAALVIGANLPDLDALAHFAGRDASLHFRRGWTHGLPALFLLPLALWLALLALRRFQARDASPTAHRLLGLSYLGVLSHPLLDWLNTYGIRVFFPFSEDWFYGDTLFIMDPGVWLLLGAATLLAGRDWRPGRWSTLAILISIPMVLPSVPIPADSRVAFFILLVVIAASRRWLEPRRERPRLAVTFLLLALLYVGFQFGSTRWARHVLEAELKESGETVLLIGPLPASPLTYDVLIRSGDEYRWGRTGWTSGFRFSEQGRLAIGPADHPAVAAALRSPEIRGFAAWLRFPFFEVVAIEGGGHEVFIMDARYTRQRTGGFGGARVFVP